MYTKHSLRPIIRPQQYHYRYPAEDVCEAVVTVLRHLTPQVHW